MIRKTVCKFRCETAQPNPNQPGEQKVLLRAEYDPNDPEDTKFSKWTPWGTLETAISNPNVEGFFVEGKSYYLTITPVDADE